MIAAYIGVLQKYAVFNGRANRPEYWWFALVQMIILTILFALAFIIHDALIVIAVVYGLATVIPSLAVTIRRLHDSGKSAWFILFNFIPFVGGIIMLVFMVLGSEAGENKYGAQPL